MSGLIEYYVDFLIDQKFTQRGQYLEPGRAAEIKQDLERELDQYLMKRMLSALSGRDLVATAEMRARGVPAEEIEDFAKAHISDFKNFFAGVLRDFGRVYLGYSLSSIHRVNSGCRFSRPGLAKLILPFMRACFPCRLPGSAACPGSLLGVSGGVVPGGVWPVRVR